MSNGKLISIDRLKQFLLSIRKEIPKNLSELQEDNEHKTVTSREKELWNSRSEESDPTVPSYVKTISQEDIQKWNKSEENVQASWSETNESSDAFIQNKPTKLSEFSNDLEVATTTNDGLMSAADKQILEDFDGAISDSFIESLFATVEGNLVTTQAELEAINSNSITDLFL